MNTTERIVESYFRVCLGCFTHPDVKVESGNNRQLDLLACNLQTGDQFHAEVSVTHCQNWCPGPEQLRAKFERKFFGVPARREGPNTDWSKGKHYKDQIESTYRSVGFSTECVKRIWVCWAIRGDQNVDDSIAQYCESRQIGHNPIQIYSFRDLILPALLDKIGTSNYEDDALRTLSLIRQFELQTEA